MSTFNSQENSRFFHTKVTRVFVGYGSVFNINKITFWSTYLKVIEQVWPILALGCKVSCECSTQNKKLTLADTQGNTHKMSYQWNFPQTKRLMNSLHTCHSSHWWWGFVCLLPIQGFFTPHIGPHIDVVITSSPPSFHLFQFGIHVVLDELRSWHKKKLPTSNLIECTLLTPKIYLKAKS